MRVKNNSYTFFFSLGNRISDQNLILFTKRVNDCFANLGLEVISSQSSKGTQNLSYPIKKQTECFIKLFTVKFKKDNFYHSRYRQMVISAAKSILSKQLMSLNEYILRCMCYGENSCILKSVEL